MRHGLVRDTIASEERPGEAPRTFQVRWPWPLGDAEEDGGAVQLRFAGGEHGPR